MTHNIIISRQETREFLVKHMENQNGEGSSRGSQHEERNIPKGFVFSSTGPHNQDNEFIKEPSIHSSPTMHEFLYEKRE